MKAINQKTADTIISLINKLPEEIMLSQFAANPKLEEVYDNRRKQLYIEDTGFHLKYLSEAIRTNRPVLFNNYLNWAKTFFAALPVDDEHILDNLKLLRDTLISHLSEDEGEIVKQYLDEGINHYNTASVELDSYLQSSNPLKEEAEQYLNYLIEANKNEPLKLILKLMDDGASIKDLYHNIFHVTQKETGRLWQLSKISVAQEHFITAATQLIMAQLYPYLFKANRSNNKIVLACVPNELHELGVRMLADLFEYEGWSTYYFGANTPRNSLLTAIELHEPKVVAISATMTYHLKEVESIIENIKTKFGDKNIKVMVGGYPFILADGLWQDIGADGFAADANSAIEFSNQLVN